MKSAAIIGFLLFSFLPGHSQTKDSTAANQLIAPWWVEKFNVTAAFFLPVNDSKIQVGLNGTANGTPIDLKKDLGFNAVTATFLANFQWRISRRSRINLSYFQINRSATHTLQRDITFDSTTYHVNSSVSSFFNTGIYQFSYGYAFVVKPRYEIGVLIGAHTLGTKAGITLNGQGSGTTLTNDYGFTAPLPDLGVWGGYAFTNRFAVNLDFDYLSLTVNKIHGELIAYNLNMIYKLMDQLYISLAYTGLNFKVSTTRKNVSGEFKWGYNGPTLGATFSFGKKSWVHPKD